MIADHRNWPPCNLAKNEPVCLLQHINDRWLFDAPDELTDVSPPLASPTHSPTD